MVLLLGKNDVVEEFARETLKIDMNNDIVYYPSVTTHYTELNKYIEIARKEKPTVITTQSLEMIDILLNSDLKIEVVCVRKHNGVVAIKYSKEKALLLRHEIGLDLRWNLVLWRTIDENK